MKSVKNVTVMGLPNLTDLQIKILTQLTCVMHAEDQVIQENIMNEKEILIKCIKTPGYAAKRLQSHYGYTMLKLQQLKENG
mgnify:CR=1 FL=1